MTKYEIISCFIAALAVLVSGFSAYFTYKNLKEIRWQFFDQNRGLLLFYIQQFPDSTIGSLFLKNFGQLPAKLLSIDISPDIVWEKTKAFKNCHDNFSKIKNVYLAPGQFLKSDFDFEKYPDTHFQISVQYETCGKLFSENYELNISYMDNLSELKTEISSELEAQLQISKNIQRFSDKFP